MLASRRITAAFVAATCAAIALIAASWPQAATARPWPSAYDQFPLDKGNTWVFVEDTQGYLAEPTQAHVMRVTDGGKRRYGWYWHDLDGLLTASSSLRLIDHPRLPGLWAQTGSERRPRFTTTLYYGARAGSEWRLRNGPCQSYQVKVVDGRDSVITTPAGEFSAPASFDFEQTPHPIVRCVDDQLNHLLTAEGVGPIAYSHSRGKGHLLFALVDGEIVATGPGETRQDGPNSDVEVTLALTTATVAHQQVMCVRAPCPPMAGVLQFALIVSNHGNDAVVLPFASSQQVELDVFDSDGNQVRRWSDDHFFTQATTTRMIGAGRTEVWYKTMPFTDREGAPLQGEFSVVGYVKSRDAGVKLTAQVDTAVR